MTNQDTANGSQLFLDADPGLMTQSRLGLTLNLLVLLAPSVDQKNTSTLHPKQVFFLEVLTLNRGCQIVLFLDHNKSDDFFCEHLIVHLKKKDETLPQQT